MKNIAAKNAARTRRQMVRKGTFDAKVFLMLLDLGLFSYRTIWDRGCKLGKPAQSGLHCCYLLLRCLAAGGGKAEQAEAEQCHGCWFRYCRLCKRHIINGDHRARWVNAKAADSII